MHNHSLLKINLSTKKKAFFTIIILFFSIYIFSYMYLSFVASINIVTYTVLPIFLIYFLFVFFTIKHNTNNFIILFLLILPFQPFFTGLLSSYLNANSVKVFVAYKEVIAIIALLILTLKYLKKRKFFFVDRALIIFLSTYLFYFLISNAPIMAKVVSLREGLMIGIFYFIGRFLIETKEKLANVLRFILLVGLIVAIFGLLEKFLFDSNIWSTLGAFDYLNLKYEIRFNEFNFPNNWYTYISDEIRVRRIVGPILEPTSFSRYIAFITLIALYYNLIFKSNNKSMYIVFIFLTIILILASSRGGLIIFIIGVSFFIFIKKPLISLLLLPVVIILFINTSILSLDSGNAVRHISGLMAGINSMTHHPLGQGLGSSGQLALLYSEIDKLAGENQGESYIGGLSYQMGILGFFGYIMFFISYFYFMIKNRKVNKGLCYLSLSGMLGIFLTSIFANSAIAPISSSISFIYSGAVVTLIEREKQ